MENFTPVSALIGGALIGASACLLWLMNGRIAGISGILGGLGQAAAMRGGDTAWRIAFLAGMIAGPAIYGLVTGRLPEITITSSIPLLVAAGLLVGFGTRLGSGCTSGHGVCGIARLSERSTVATAIFMAAGFAAAFLLRHVFAG